MKLLFNNKIVIVTGGTRGIGREISLLFAQEGAIVYAIYNQDEINAQNFGDLIKKNKLSNRVRIRKVSVSNYNSLKMILDEIKKEHTKIDIVINNAGVLYNAIFPLMKISHCDEIIDTNLKGAIYTSYITSRYMVAKKSGTIINIASIAAFTNFKGNSVYACSKAAIVSFTKAIALELEPYNIRVICIAPGLVDTEMTSNMDTNFKKFYLDSFETISTTQISNLVKDICYKKDKYINGETYPIGF